MASKLFRHRVSWYIISWTLEHGQPSPFRDKHKRYFDIPSLLLAACATVETWLGHLLVTYLGRIFAVMQQNIAVQSILRFLRYKSLTHAPLGGWGAIVRPPPVFLLTSAKLMELSTRNLHYLSGHRFYTLCANTNFAPTVGWLQITPE